MPYQNSMRVFPTIESLIAVLTASTTIMLSNVLQNSQKRPTSPLPDTQDWLHVHFCSFGEERGLSKDIITAVVAALGAKGYPE